MCPSMFSYVSPESISSLVILFLSVFAGIIWPCSIHTFYAFFIIDFVFFRYTGEGMDGGNFFLFLQAVDIILIFALYLQKWSLRRPNRTWTTLSANTNSTKMRRPMTRNSTNTKNKRRRNDLEMIRSDRLWTAH